MRGALVLTAAALTLWAAPAAAHHILGIPHYKYGEEYPQIPFVEIQAQVGAHDLSFTYFPGTPEPGEPVRFKLYVRQRKTGEPFRQALEVTLYKKTAFGGRERIGTAFTIRPGSGPEANDYKFFRTFDAAEAYEVVVRFDDGSGAAAETIPFPVTIGVTDDRPLLAGAAGTLLLAVIIVAVVKRRRRGRGPARRGEGEEQVIS